MTGWGRFPFVRYTAALAAGITGFLLTEKTPTVLPGIALAAGLILLFFGQNAALRSRPDAPLFRGIAALVFLTAAGWLLTGSRVETNQATHFQRFKTSTGYVATLVSLPETKTYSFRAVAQVSRVRTAAGWRRATGRVLLDLSLDAPSPPRYGDVLLLSGVPRPTAPPLNPGEFDYRAFLARQQIFHRHSVTAEGFRRLGNAPPSRLTALAYRLNRYADSLLTAALPDRREYSVANAMLLGVRDDLDTDLMRAYSAAGAVHVLSVSGLHVGVLFVVLGWLLGWLRKKGPAGEGVFLGLMLGILWFYALLTGFSAPVLRSAVMFSMLLIGDTLGRQRSTYNTLFASAFGLLLIDPFWLAAPGFQLSYLAVLGIVYLQPRLAGLFPVQNDLGRLAWGITATAVAAQLATWPLCIYYFHQFPLYFLGANPVVIALSSAALPLGLGFLGLKSVPWLGEWLGDFLAFWLNATFWLLNEAVLFTEQLPGAVWRNLSFSSLETMGYYLLIISLLTLFYTRRKAPLWGAAGLAVVLGGAAFFEKKTQQRQHYLVLHHLPRHTALSLIEGTRLTVLADSELVANPRQLDYACAGFWASRGIRHTRFVSLQAPQSWADLPITALPTGWLLVWRRQRVAGLQQATETLRTPQPLDYLLVAGEAARQPPGGLWVRRVVLDGSCKPWYLSRWPGQKEGVWVTSGQGAVVAQF